MVVKKKKTRIWSSQAISRTKSQANLAKTLKKLPRRGRKKK